MVREGEAGKGEICMVFLHTIFWQLNSITWGNNHIFRILNQPLETAFEVRKLQQLHRCHFYQAMKEVWHFNYLHAWVFKKRRSLFPSYFKLVVWCFAFSHHIFLWQCFPIHQVTLVVRSIVNKVGPRVRLIGLVLK